MARRAVEDKPMQIKHGTPEMEAFIGVGYDGMTLAEAKKIIAERDKDPHLWPYEEYKKAKAFIETYYGKKMP